MRVVCDTSVLIEAFLGQGLSDQLVRHAMRGDISLIVSQAILRELEDKLKNKFRVAKKDREEFIDIIRSTAGTVVFGNSSVQAPESFKGDEHLLAAAIEGEAAGIITHDKKLIRTKSVGNVAIMHPRSILYILEGIRRT